MITEAIFRIFNMLPFHVEGIVYHKNRTPSTWRPFWIVMRESVKQILADVPKYLDLTIFNGHKRVSDTSFLHYFGWRVDGTKIWGKIKAILLNKI